MKIGMFINTQFPEGDSVAGAHPRTGGAGARRA